MHVYVCVYSSAISLYIYICVTIISIKMEQNSSITTKELSLMLPFIFTTHPCP